MARRLAWLIAVAAVVAAGAYAGAWFVPFLAGLAVGAAASRLGFPSVPFAVLACVVGWAVPLWVLALRGLPAGATARVIAGLAGLPPHAAVTVAVTLLLAALQVLAGAWLARALLPRRRASE
ncbi:hypothetical protein [Trebonia sp.]|uniref:hypothetical protein n=1 Tax=Trebonia sp. TaxID=2767075 RepID=UPI002616C8D2|nr:hypothetical protein [Trebonia sp.]